VNPHRPGFGDCDSKVRPHLGPEPHLHRYVAMLRGVGPRLKGNDLRWGNALPHFFQKELV